MTKRRALLLGATGLIGNAVLSRLLACDEYSAVTLIGRRHPVIDDDKLDTISCELSDLNQYTNAFAVDDVFCCLGSTLKAAGSRQAFYQVDHDFCVAAAQQAKAAAASRFLMVSAVNAKPASLSYYARVKAQTETDVEDLALPHTVLMQPSLLEGERSEMRLGEAFGQVAMTLAKPLLSWTQADWLSVRGEDVADAMVMAALQKEMPAIQRIRYKQICRMSEQLRSAM